MLSDPVPAGSSLWCLQTPKWKRKDEREKRLGEMMERQRRRMKKAHEMKKKGGKVWADICLASFHLACSLTNHSPPSLVFHKVGGKMTSLIWQRQTSKPHKSPPTPLSDTSSLLWGAVYVCACVLYSEGCIFFTGLWSHTERRWDEPSASARFLLTERYWGVSHSLAGWLWLCVRLHLCV